MVEFEHDWPLASALIERWRPESDTFHIPCGEMTITLQDVAYQLRLKIDGDLWIPLLEDLEMYGRLSWGSTMLAWLYRQMCRATEHGQCNLAGWVQYWLDNAKDENRLRHYSRTLNGIGMLNVEWTPYANPRLIALVPLAIAEAEAERRLSVCCFASLLPSGIRLDGRFGRGGWFPQLIGGWHELWDARANHRLYIHHHIDLCPSLPYMTRYLKWADTELFGLGDQHLVAAGVVLEDLPIHHPLAPDLYQPDDGHLSEMMPDAGGGRCRGGGEPEGEVDAVQAEGGKLVTRFTATETPLARQLTRPRMLARRLGLFQDPYAETTCP
ncbi:hypothetical protein Ahy_A09g042612 [Arachis hypogaea]|uniref:Aminotransferase-like plant mobile domain-containing protein n=1 Tax=Arachis hypogaea TaxID=3818 RepID=A0A445BGC6_ARAHY|nr:hypothetical protein Ahy_A09g042612 [Arachis hypogaea]